jgi:hypothetical protein
MTGLNGLNGVAIWVVVYSVVHSFVVAGASYMIYINAGKGWEITPTIGTPDKLFFTCKQHTFLKLRKKLNYYTRCIILKALSLWHFVVYRARILYKNILLILL